MVQSRVARNEDAKTISSVLAASWKSAYRGIVENKFLDSIKTNQWVDFLTAGTDNVFAMALEEDQNIIGGAILSGEKNQASLISFYLLPEKIGQGFGHLFFCEIETELRRRGFSICVLDVLEHNTRAIRFYEAHGFIDTNMTIKTSLGGNEYLCKEYEKIIV